MSIANNQQSKYLDQLTNLVITIGGCQTTEMSPDKDKERICQQKAIEYIDSDRFNLDFKDEIEK